MEVKLEVLISRSIRRKKPCSRFCWLGQEKESVFLLDDNSFSEINLVSGRIKKKVARLQPLLKNKNVAVLGTSRNGAWLAGVLTSGEIFIWNKDQDVVKTIPLTEELSNELAASEERCRRLYLFVSEDGRRLLLATTLGSVFVWESIDIKNFPSSWKGPLSSGRWSRIDPDASTVLPDTDNKETAVHAIFIRNQTLGDCCLCSFAFYIEDRLMLVFLLLRWHENAYQYISSLPYDVHWSHQECSLSSLVPSCTPVKSKGALITAFAGDGLVLAATINQKDPEATQVLFVNIVNFVTISGSLKGCSSKNHMIPTKFIRSYWVGDMSWTHDSLFLACILKRGALVLLTRLGDLLSLVTTGCSVEFGPAEFIPLHPLITYRSSDAALQTADGNSSLGSTASEKDMLRQRFSVTTHPRSPYLIVSDGYMVTALRFINNYSPSSFMKSLLLDSAQSLEAMRQLHLPSKHHKGKRPKLRSLSSLKASILKAHGSQNSTFSMIPRFLQGEEEMLELRLADLQVCEEDSEDEVLPKDGFTSLSFKHDSSGKSVDHGRLEFASMFDTIHATDATDEMDDEGNVFSKLNCIQKNLMTAWSLGISFGTIEEKDVLLNSTIGFLTHLINVLQFLKRPPSTKDKFSRTTARNSSWVHFVFKLFQQCLIVLQWDVPHRQGFRHIIKLTSEVVKLMTVCPQDQPFSRTLLEAFSLLKMVSYYLNIIYTPQCNRISASVGKDLSVELDSLFLPLCQNLSESKVKDFFFMDVLCSLPPRTSTFEHSPDKRLTFLWRLLYQHALRFQAQLCLHVSRNDSQLKEKINDEESIIAVVLCHIQATLQSSGDTLEKAVRLEPVTGEEHFLLGSYKESVQIWKRALQENTAPEGKRTCFLQMRYFLAMLYCHLYYNNLSEAQGLCDHLTRELLSRSRLPFDQLECNSESPRADDLGLLRGVHVKAALTVVQSMARFMASYFTNQPLYVLPPHNVNILPPLHIRQEKCPRVVPLQHCTVANAVRDQNLSSVWTVEYALDLLLIGGLIPEAAWFALQLGDWKMSVSIGLAYNLSCQITEDRTWLNSVEMQLPPKLTPAHTFQEKLQSFLGRPGSSEIIKAEGRGYKQFTDPIEDEDTDALFSSVQEMLKAAVMAEADILSETFLLLIEAAKDLSKGLSGLVPEKLYLPAPPLYCPQPASVSEGDYGDQVLASEKDYRQKLSGVLQRILLLLRAARCSIPSAQWYIKKLKWARKVMQKIRAKSFLPPLSQLPESLLNYSRTNSTFFKTGPDGDKLDDVSCKIIGSFRELCALCWMLHVREKLSDGCRRYQISRDNMEKQQDFEKTVPFDSSVVEQCLNALEWAYRMLPFSAFLNIEELVQDIILSLIGELPPVQKVAEILVKAFPSSEAVRVSLRDKYHSLQQRLRHCMVKGPKGEEMMSLVMHNFHKVRIKTLKRVVRNIGPIEMNIWEPEEENPDNEVQLYDRFSMGTSLSRSTLTEFGKPQVYSDADTGDTLSEALMTEEPIPRMEMSVTEDLRYNNDTLYRKKDISAKSKTDQKEPKETTLLPSVGTWEFERDDDEYIAFLDLFMSYLLERDLINYTDPCIPFLTSFSEHLREFELNSLLFDVHTTLKRRQGRSKHCNVFRAGYSYTASAEAGAQPVNSVQPCDEKENALRRLPSNPTSLIFLPASKPSLIQYFNEGNNATLGKKGLFGLNLRTALQEDHQEESSACPKEPHQSTETPVVVNTFKIIHFESVLPSEELLTELKTKFGGVSRLLEWMIRWSEKQLLCGSSKEELIRENSTIIRVKTSAAAILTSLWLLEERHCAGCRDKNTNFRIPDAENIKAPVFQSMERQTMQRESSVDTGYRGSTGTPIDALEENLYEDVCESDPESSSIHDHKDELEEVQDIQQKVLDIPSTSEDDFEDDFDPVSPSISVNIRPVQRLTENSVETYEIPYRESESEKLEEKKTHHDSTCASEQPGGPPLVCADMKVSTPSDRGSPAPASSYGPSFPTLPDLHAENVQSHAAIYTSPLDTHNSDHRTQPQNTSEAVRQMFQDEMFRLLQLQQINFMSLMQIVGSSFASLPQVQQLLQQSQPINLQEGQTSANVRGLVTEGLLTTPAEDRHHMISVPPVQQPHTMKSGGERATNSSNSLPSPDESSKENQQDHTELKREESRPSKSRMLLATCNMLDSVNGKASIDTQNVIPLVTTPQNLSAAKSFPLLHLSPERSFKPEENDTFQSFARPPQNPREAWVTIETIKNRKDSETPEYSSGVVQPHVNQQVKHFKQKEKQKKKSAVCVKTETPKNVHVNPYMLNSNRATLPQNLKHAVAPSLESKVSSQGAFRNQAGFPLLHMQVNPVPLFPHIIRPNNAGLIIPPHDISRKDIQVPQQIPKLTLLHASIPLENKVISQVLPFQPPRLIPLQHIIAYKQSIQNKSEQLFEEHVAGSIKLLKANIEPFEGRDVQKERKGRVRRRLEKQHKQEHVERPPYKQDNTETKLEKQVQIIAELEGQERMNTQPGNQEKIETKTVKKTSVSFRPQDSIIELIPVDDNSSEIIDNSEVHQNDVPNLENGEGFVLPLGMFDSLLLEQNNEHRSVPAPAELHYMAATKRKAAEIQDASTNTDPGSGLKSNHEYLPSTVPQLLPPDLYQNLRFLNGLEEQIVPSKTSDPETVPPKHQYINVIDIEASDFLKDLPTRESPEEELTRDRADHASAPSSAQLHHMAASVTNVIPPDEFESTDYLLQLPVSQSQNLNEKPGVAGDVVTWNLLQDDLDIVKPSERSVKTFSAKPMSKVHMDSKLHEMEAQLSALQNMAEYMERDFANSELLVNTIENLGSAMDSVHEEIPYSSTGIQDTTKELFFNPVRLEDLIEEEEEDSKSELIANNASAWQTPAYSAVSAANPASTTEASAAERGDVRHQCIDSRLKKPFSVSDFPRVEEVRESFSDAPLEMTGLSDIADIIGDLVRHGGVAASELGLTEAQARIFSRASNDKANSTRLTKKMESKRQEIRDWMKLKQKERLAEHCKKREELREREYDPFRPQKDLQRTFNSSDLRKIQKAKEEKDKTLLSEHHSHRVAQAFTLMNNILSATSQAPATNPYHPPNSPLRLKSPQSIQGQPLTRQRVYSLKRSLSANPAEKRRAIPRTGSSQARSLSTPSYGSAHSRGPWTLPKKIPDSRAQSATSYSLKAKIETSLPRDRMSQITRRGILVNRSTKKGHAHVEGREKPGFDAKRPVSANPGLAFDRSGKEIFRKPTKQAAECQTNETGLENEDSDSLSHWEVPDEINRILNSSQDAWSLLQEEEHFPQSFNDIDNMSESTGSILSKLDWNMIEDMVASVEEKSN
ncbi:ciliogenesis and planar polarity effector 1 isoform X1 [Pleurodeles waltl]|uniref:ciliogenesis and planar polarity effector 1 isoform X1 n=1 Tax=Pleurodeles waltl TaxID=8319 RepID=UPI0037097F86